jgi:hypothetical protein
MNVISAVSAQLAVALKVNVPTMIAQIVLVRNK